MTEGSSTSSLFEATRLGLSRLALSQADELTRALEHACKTSAQALNVERTSIWFISRNGKELHCAALYELEADRFGNGAQLHLELLPGYLAELEAHRVLTSNGGSSLDAPVFRLGEVVGVVRCDKVDGNREWSSRDRHFAGSLADLVAILLEQATRLDVEAALSSQRERLAKAEKMEALSRMSAGVAHDFNNVLTAMLLRVETVRLDRAADSELFQALGEVLEAGARGARLVQQLLTFAKAKVPAPRPVDVSRTLRDMEPMLLTLMHNKAILRIERPATAALVSVDPSQLEQVVLNLVMNARDASPTKNAEVKVSLTVESEAAVLTVVDQGAGMDAATREQVFEPFFTTKEQGSGLGLSTVYSIVQQAGGSVAVESAVGSGTTFSVRLPRIQ
ncbi:MAG TPA: GAF domain-containing sensor histidine kinase [Polyangiaceae bacterium]|nr:GAF domain-containing sensor histidine kinase [Polyangiaceae bacterium]